MDITFVVYYHRQWIFFLGADFLEEFFNEEC